jgi:ribosomal protein S18 acetylase RimI-like enzyme
MPLPILHTTTDSSPQTLLRLFDQTEHDYVRHLSTETPLEVGTAFHNSELKNVFDANCVLDAALPENVSPADAVREAMEHYESVGSILRRWILNPSAPTEKTEPLRKYLIDTGHHEKTADIMHLQSMPTSPVREVGGLMIIPSRASFKHARQLAEEGAKRWNEPTLADAAMLHLDDPHWDSLIALRDNVAVAHIAVMAMGEVGRIEDVFVSEKARRQGIARTMMSRALEICARSLFKHVLLCVAQDNAPAQALYTSLGFKKIGTASAYNKFASQGSAI